MFINEITMIRPITIIKVGVAEFNTVLENSRKFFGPI